MPMEMTGGTVFVLFRFYLPLGALYLMGFLALISQNPVSYTFIRKIRRPRPCEGHRSKHQAPELSATTREHLPALF